MPFYFQTQKVTTYGDRLFIVGNTETYGSWNPLKGVELTTNIDIYPLWMTDVVYFTADEIRHFQYKYIIIRPNGELLWEDGSNRTLINKLHIEHCIYNDNTGDRSTKNITFTDRNKLYNNVFSALCNVNNVFITIHGEIKQLAYSQIIKRDYAQKKIILKLNANYVKINKCIYKNLPYYCMTFDKDEQHVKLSGPFERLNINRRNTIHHQ